MTSESKKKKLKNSHFIPSWLKNKTMKLKGNGFFNASQRQDLKQQINKDLDYEHV